MIEAGAWSAHLLRISLMMDSALTLLFLQQDITINQTRYLTKSPLGISAITHAKIAPKRPSAQSVRVLLTN
jgi:hypothetical protein